MTTCTPQYFDALRFFFFFFPNEPYHPFIEYRLFVALECVFFFFFVCWNPFRCNKLLLVQSSIPITPFLGMFSQCVSR